MNKADAMLIVQLLHSMKEGVLKMEKYMLMKDMEKFEAAKKEVLEMQKKIDSML